MPFVLALLSSVVVTGVIGALAFRNGGVPRYAMLQMALCEIPLCVGMLFQADRWVWLLALKSPFYAMGMMNIVRDHARMLTTTIFIEQKTRDLAARLDAALVNMPVGVLMFEAENGLQVWNERAAEILQIDFNAIERGVGLNFLLKMAAIMPAPEALLDFEELVNRLEHDRGEAQALLPTGRAILLMGRNDHNGILSIMIKDITQRRQAEARVTYLAHHDALTGLSNRNDFNERLTAYYDLENGLSFTLLYIDLDGFKNINDTLGHQAGDQLLRAVAGRLSNTAPPNSTIARLGGDEFAVIAPLTCADAVTLAEQLIINIARPYKLDFDYPVVVGASIGVAQAHESLSAEMLQSCADRALYAAKAAGRGVVRVFNDKLLKGENRKIY